MTSTKARYRVDEITEQTAWDRCVTSFPAHDLRQSFAWGAFKVADGWKPLRLAVLDGARCLAAASVLSRRIGMTSRSIFYAPRGPLFDPRDGIGPLAALFVELSALARTHQTIFLRMSPENVTSEALGDAAAAARARLTLLSEYYTTWNTPRLNMSLPLVDGERGVLARMRKTTRQGLSVAQKRGVRIYDAKDGDGFGDLHRLLLMNSQRKRIPVRGAEYFERLGRLLPDVRLSFAEYEGQRIAGQLSVLFGHRLHILYYGADPSFLNLGTARALDWHHARHAIAAGCTEVDFGGSATGYPPQPSDAGYGVFQYKLGLGCELRQHTPYSDLVFQPRLYRLLRYVEHHVLPVAWSIKARY
jgi:lipid II:glycine glycyltransferase (peptidoglycan interpeptide bridge formation enzyme)